jgi:hypothetical protein
MKKVKAIDKYIFFSFDWNIPPLSSLVYLIHSSKSLKGAERSKSPCLVSFSRYIMGETIHICPTMSCIINNQQNDILIDIYIYDNETFAQLSYDEWNIIIQIEKSETDKMLKRAYKPSTQIRQATRHIIKEKKLVACVYAGHFFLSLSLFFSVECQNRRIEQWTEVEKNTAWWFMMYYWP